MKAKLLICGILVLGLTGVASVSFLHQEHDSYNVAIRAET